MAAPGDDEIARAIRRGDPGAFDAFFARFGAPLLHFLTGMSGDRALAEDLVQETALRVYRGIARYEERGTFHAWVYRIASNLALTELRRRPESPLPLDERVRELPDPRARDAGEAMDDQRRARALDAALAELSPGHCAVLLLRVRGEMDIATIARVLGIPEGTVKSRIHNAVLRLRSSTDGMGGRNDRGGTP